MAEMEVFLTDDNRTYVAVDGSVTKEKALTIGNKRFHINRKMLRIGTGWVRNDTLYFDEIRGAKKVWLVWRKAVSEK